MSRFQSIENAIRAINPASFQELCDHFLVLRNRNYRAISRIGSQTGKQKTIKGTPDSFLILPDGKYIFVEYSTDSSRGIRKIEEDLKKCIDFSKTNIHPDQISEIIVCINFNLSAKEIGRLQEIVMSTRIVFTIYTLDFLALEIHLHHRDLANEYLGLPLDTGQIVSIDVFIREYNMASKGIAAPLDNSFLHREKELAELQESLIRNDFIILTGAAGVGKTRLALEGIKQYLKANPLVNAYCVSYKNYDLLPDLYQYLDYESDYLLFVDDANRIDAFSQIFGFYKSFKKGSLKIVITTRDYSFTEFASYYQNFLPQRIDIAKLKDEQIIDIIKAPPLGITNNEYYEVITSVADGNPRIAIMMALLALQKQNLFALRNVSSIFEKYFNTFINDDSEFANEFNLKCLGIISFFYVIPYKNKDITSAILSNFDINYSQFIEAINKLDKLELVEIQFNYVKIPEQNLANYFFYKAFIDLQLLSFSTLLNCYFETNSKEFKDSVIPANNIFGPENVMNKLRPFLNNYLKKISNNEDKVFKFLETFWYYLRDETLNFIFEKIAKIPFEFEPQYNLSADNKDFHRANKILDLLSNFFRSPENLRTAVELSFNYVNKQSHLYTELIRKIKENLTFAKEDVAYSYLRQNILFDYLIEGLGCGDDLRAISFFELAKTFLSFKFRHTNAGRNMSIVFYEFPLSSEIPIRTFREKLWVAIESNFPKYPQKSFELIRTYSFIHPDVDKSLMQFDLTFLIPIIINHLSVNSFEHCQYVQDQISWCKRMEVFNPAFMNLEQRFTNQYYKSFLKLDWNRLRDKEMFEFENHDEYNKLKEQEIRTSFKFSTLQEVEEFYSFFVFLQAHAKSDFRFNNSLDIVCDENFSVNPEIGLAILFEVIKANNVVRYVPNLVFRNHLKKEVNAKSILNLIEENQFLQKANWQLSFHYFLDESLITRAYSESLLKAISAIEDVTYIRFDFMHKYLKADSELFVRVLKKIFVLNTSIPPNAYLWEDVFVEYFDNIKEDMETVKNSYLQQAKIQNTFDFEGKGFINILQFDNKFLTFYVKNIHSDNSYFYEREKSLGFIWDVPNIEPSIIELLDYYAKREEDFGFSRDSYNSFFIGLKETNKLRAKELLFKYSAVNSNYPHKINMVVDIIRNILKEYYEEFILLYLKLNQSSEDFNEISWRGTSTSGVGDVILADIEAADWRNILSIVEKSDIGINLLPIKLSINRRIDYCLERGNEERKRRFLDRR